MIPRPVRIHAILLTKNEADIIEPVLRAALCWAHAIYVYDGASTDGTWEIVRSLAEEDARIYPWRSEAHVFSEGLRADVFNAFRHLVEDGDWWCQLNADEIFEEDPRTFLGALPPGPWVVWGLMAQYYVTLTMVDQIDWHTPWETRQLLFRHYEWVKTGEPRFFCHRRALKWSSNDAWPRHLGWTYPTRIVLKHYPYRSPQQIQERLDIRRAHRAAGFEGWAHAAEEDWKKKCIVDPDKLVERNSDGSLQAPPVSMLQAPVESLFKKLLKMIMHRLGVWP